MLTSVKIDDYRCLHNLVIDPVCQINLIVGKNRVGKTALMEWLRVCDRPQLPGPPTMLIDEIERKLHYSEHADLWRALVNNIRVLDLQIFATTQSWDTIVGLNTVLTENPDITAQVIRLEQVEGEEQTGAVIIDRAGLAIVIRDLIEIR